MRVSEAIGQEAGLLFAAFLVGAALFLLYDILRIFRRIVPHGNLWIGVEDFVYWLVCTAAVFVMLYRENDGLMRGFAFGGLSLGMAFYYLLPSRYVVRVNVWIWKAVLRFFGKIFGVFLRPACKIVKKTARFFRKELKKFWKTVKISLSKL